jgi:lysozyme
MNKKAFLVGALAAGAWFWYKTRINYIDYGVVTNDGVDEDSESLTDSAGGYVKASLNQLTGISIGDGVNDNLLTSIAGINYLKGWENPAKKGRNSAGLWFEHDDGAGIPTIGYGHKILPLENFDNGLNDAEIESLFVDDLSQHAQCIYDFVKVPLTQNQFDALVSFVYNVGKGAFKKSTLLKRLNAGLYSEAADQFMRWVYAGGVVMSGLYNRRYSDMQVFRNGVYKQYYIAK